MTDRADGVHTVTLHQPQRLNAFDRDDLADLVTALEEAGRSEARAVLLAGGGRAFCAGADLGFVEQLRHQRPSERAAGLGLGLRAVTDLVRLPVPTVAAVQGACYGGGACLALACDLVVAADDARLGFVFTRLGLPGSDMAAPWLLRRRIGTRRAWRLLADAAVLDAGEALDLGLVDEVVPHDRLRDRATGHAARWAAAAPAALRETKRELLALEGAGDDLTAHVARARTSVGRGFDGDELGEGLAAAHEGRDPRYSAE